MKRLGVSLGFLLLATPVAGQTTIETISFWNGASSVSPFGKVNTATYGQTFTVPGTDNILQSFSFFLRDIGAGNNLIFQGYVSAWDPGAGLLTGPLLYSSGNRSGPPLAGDFARYDFITGGTSLVAGGTYVAFLSASGHFGDIPGGGALTDWGYRGADVYGGGGFVFFNNGDDFGLLSTNSWESFGSVDLAFELQFGEGGAPSTVPEPSSVILVGTGIGILLLGVRRRKQR